MQLEVITPTGTKFDGDVERFQFTSAHGLMEFLPGHAPMIAEIKEGIITTDTDEIDCGNGVVKIENDLITVVCE
ncbi:MAG: F0F1 ATP synthase subunit epsilon [Bacteroidaceae bacterium]|nr:F0F1 ATP synthase subunit epsilon [Bacteroidaceae bacterium]MBR1520818.1 F0F1 ATP synthase subunit epsilon [Bacteroidaceae bacterium]